VNSPHPPFLSPSQNTPSEAVKHSKHVRDEGKDTDSNERKVKEASKLLETSQSL